jgi:hypothetical protein
MGWGTTYRRIAGRCLLDPVMKRPTSSLFRFLFLLCLSLGVTAWMRAQTVLPDATAGAAYSFQLKTTPPQPAGTTYSANGLPSGLSIGATSGLITGTTATVGNFNGFVTLTNSAVTSYPFQIAVDPAAGSPTLTSQGAAVGTVGTPFSYTITASNNPTSYNVAELPPGLTANGAVISGTPTKAGLYFTSISANNTVGQGAILVVMWTINPAGPLPVITSGLLVSGQPGTPFTYTIAATNGPTSFSALGLPPGLALNSTTGVISGTPTTAAISSVNLIASNQYGDSPALNLTLTIGNFSAITSAAALTGTVGSPLNYTLTASNNPTSFSLTGLPAGLTFNSSTGAVVGTPAAAGTYTLTASAANSLGSGVPSILNLTVTGGSSSTGGNSTAPVILLPPSDQTTTVGSNVRFSVTAVGSGTLSYQWLHNGSLISGATGPILQISLVTGADAGAYTVTVSNAAGSVTSGSANLIISSFTVPPVITAQPVKTSSIVGAATTFTVGASGSAPLSYQWLVGGTPIAGATAASFIIPSTKLADAGTYSVVVTNPFGTATSVNAVLSVSATASAPIFQYQPNPTTVNAGGTASFSVGVVGTPPLVYQWFKNGAPLPGATGPALSFPAAQVSDSGSYNVTITNPVGSITSAAAPLTVTTGGTPVPVKIVQQPIAVSTNHGGGATFSVAVTGDATITYQWRKNQAPIAGATGPTYNLYGLQDSDAATYDVLVANGFSATISFPTPLTVTPVAVPSRLTNVSVLGFNGLNNQALAIGFVIGGSGSENTLVRAVGPSLSAFGLKGLLADPQLTVYSSGVHSLASNDNWGGGAALSTAFTQTGAFALPAASLDAALTTVLAAGSYTAVVTGTNNGTGSVLLEAYDADTGATPSARFTNISARGTAGSGANALSLGFAISGTVTKTLLIRGVGPTLSAFGVTGTLATPQLTVYDSTQTPIAFNAGWTGSAALTAAFNAVGAFGLPPTSTDAALLITLSPGTYSAQVSSTSAASGVALLEMYEIP